MTGYGRGVAERDGWRAAVEIRSVNHRFLDLKLRGATLEPSLEELLRKSVASACARGSVTVSIKVERRGGSTPTVDMDAAERVYHQLLGLAERLGTGQPVTLELVCKQPGVLVAHEEPAEGEALASCVTSALGKALEIMVRMRATEAQALEADVRQRLENIAAVTQTIDAESGSAPETLHARLVERVSRLLDTRNAELSPERLAQEIALAADRVDITEELVRLRSHIDHMGALMDEARSQETPVGRRLDFLVQEMGREINTIGSKSQSSTIAHAVVEAKAQLEKIREQVQNLE